MGRHGYIAKDAERDETGGGIPQRPSHLTGHAADEWDRIVAGYDADRMKVRWFAQLEIICDYYAEWKWLAEECDHNEMLNHVGENGSLQQNPLVARRDKAAEMYLKWAEKLGLTPTGELRLPKIEKKQTQVRIARDRNRA